ncbi:restriction endonuclease subunit S [Burkholderia pyrrocinia]
MNKHTAELLEKHFDTAFAAPDGVKKLRELILTLAMQGKLVSQDPNDQAASELLKEIEAEKQRMARDGRLKKSKPLSPVTASEQLHALPCSWEWVRLGNIATKLTDGSHNPPRDAGSGFPMLSSQNVANERIDFAKPSRYVSQNDFDLENKRTTIEAGDVLLTIVASLGRPAVVPLDAPKFVLQRSVAVVRTSIAPRFLCKAFLSPNCTSYFDTHAKGTAQKGIYLGKLSEMPIPLPPLAEQIRIVAKIDELMTRCDELEKLRTTQQEARLIVHAAAIKRLLNIAAPDQHQRALTFLAEHFGELYTAKENVAELRKAILQLAVMGKLVPQNPNDQHASELLKEIEAEKQRLVTAKKIKRPKPALSVSRGDEPFSIPDNWRWVRIAELAQSIDYGTSQKTCDDSSLVPVYRMGNIVNGQLINSEFKYITPKIDELPHLFLQPNDILFNRTNSYELVGKSARYTGLADQATFASYLIRIRLSHELLNPIFINLAMNAPYFRSTQIEPEIVQQCGQANFNGTKLSLCAIPLPPLSEQQRIVTRIDQLMALCSSLDREIDATTRKQAELLNALIRAQSQSDTEQDLRPASLSKVQVTDLAAYRAAIGCYAISKLANAQYFGRTAAAKMMYLAQAHVGLELNLKPEREAAGPLDMWIYDFERKGQTKGWFEVNEKTLANGRKKAEYRCLSALSEPAARAEVLMSSDQKVKFDCLIYALADKKTEEVEIIATLFAVWNDFLIDGIQPTDAQIISELRENWHERKARFSPADLGRWLDWLRKKNIIPCGLPPRTVQQSTLDFA